MRTKLAAVLALVIATAAALAATAVAGTEKASSAQALSCSSGLKLAVFTPLTGGSGELGNEQLSWVKLAVANLAKKKYGLNVRIVQADTPTEKGPGEGLVVAQKLIADKSVVASIGPATSGTVASASQALADAGIAHISPSATRTALTKGAEKQASSAFFRVVPGDYIQGPSDANFMIDKLKAKKVVIVDFQEPYSVGLAEAAQAVLKRKNVEVIRLSTGATTTDFSSLVTKVPSDADVVFILVQQPSDAQTFGQQMIEQGKKAKLFGPDGANGSSFKIPGAYVSNFAPDISGFAYNKALIAQWEKANPGKRLGSFGPPAYLATEVALNAVKRACEAGNGKLASRKDVIRQVKRINIKNTITGGDFRFSTKSNDPLNGKFYIFQIQSDGSLKLVG